MQPVAILLADSAKVDLSYAWRSGDRILSINRHLAAPSQPDHRRGRVRHLPHHRQRNEIDGPALQQESPQGPKPRHILLGQVAQITVAIVGFLIALSVIAPSFQASDLIKAPAVIGSVAIGFAFQNILQNFLAGVLVLLHEPFTLGDTISVTGLEGQVEDIQARATIGSIRRTAIACSFRTPSSSPAPSS